MRKRSLLVGILAVLAGSAVSACELVGGLEKATLYEAGGGGQGGATATGGGGTTASGGTTSMGGTTTSTVCEPGMTLDCYSGPAGTEMVGICHGGTKTCVPDGSGYPDACALEQAPMAETCADTADEDCDGHDCARWANIYGDAAVQAALAIGVDAAGNAYVLGSFVGALPVLNPALVSAGQSDLFLVKVDPAGQVLWAKQYGDPAVQGAGALAVDPNGNVAVVTPFDGTVDFGKGNLGPGGTAIFKVDTDGNTLWSKHIAQKLPGYVAINKDGDVIYWTDFAGKVDFGTGQLDAVLFRDTALVKFAGLDGVPQFAKQFGYSGDYEWADGLAIDGGNNIVVAGGFTGKINLGGGDLVKTPAHATDMFVGRFDKNGTFSAQASYAKIEGASMMQVDSLGSALLVWGFQSSPDTYSSGLTKVDNMVAEVWTKTYEDVGGGGYNTDLTCIAIDTGDNVTLAFRLEGANDVGGGVLMPVGTMDIVLAKLDVSGGHLWSRRFGAVGESQGRPVVAAAPNGDIVLAAGVTGPIDVGTGSLTTNGQDLLIARFAP